MIVPVAASHDVSLAKADSHANVSRVALFAAGLFMLMRLVYLALPDLFPEEAYYWNYARHLDIGYLDHPPLVGWLIYLGTSLFGNGELGVRFFAPVCSLVTTGFAYLLTKFFYGRRVGIMAVLLVQVLPFFFMSGLMMTPDAPLAACWSGMLYFLARAVFASQPRAWWGVGLCLGLGLLSKYTIALLGPATLLFLALDPVSRGWFRRATPYASVLLGGLIFSPVIIWNATHHWASFAFQTTGRVASPAHFSLHELAGATLLFLTPVGLFLAGKLLLGRRGEPMKTEASPRFDPARLLLFARVFTLVPLSVFVLFSLRHPVKLNWVGPLCLAVIPLLAAHLVNVSANPDSRLRKAWVTTGALFGLAYLALLHHLAIGIPGLGYPAQTELLPVGWSELGDALSLQKQALRQASPGKTLVVGLDRNFIASEAAFYQPNQAESVRETTGGHLFGAISLMYEPWFPAKDQAGATLLLVSFHEHDLRKHQIAKCCERLGPIKKHWLQRNGVKIRPYYTRVGYNYRSIKS